MKIYHLRITEWVAIEQVIQRNISSIHCNRSALHGAPPSVPATAAHRISNIRIWSAMPRDHIPSYPIPLSMPYSLIPTVSSFGFGADPPLLLSVSMNFIQSVSIHIIL